MTKRTLTSPSKMIKWDEDRTTTTSAPRLTPAHTNFTLPALNGTIETRYLMTYLEDGSATFIYSDIVEIEIPSTSSSSERGMGKFITQRKGSFDPQFYSVQGEFEIVQGTGTGCAKGINGKGSFKTAPIDGNPKNVDYVFELII